jgi:phage tail tape-measure protein
LYSRLSIGRGAALLVGGALCVVSAPAEAQEFCVACVEPPAVYRCVIEGARPGGGQPLQSLCVTAMTKEGRHASCSLKGGTVFDCNGPVRKVSWAANSPNAPASAISTVPPKQEAPKQGAPEQPAKNSNQPPATVEEMAKRAGEKSADQAKSFGESVGDASKKTWRCIASLLTRCGE